ncbi:hypothetical protein CUT44_15480 [Streptomyces carminius]|uniref:Uncharacterized protein n=1 Tax=Streptomyces carminius TaxID=2665496 RepID=A0A2M8LYC9_9ACTN|nr:hypothetical protein [Streptomyces carminius]PJE96950.1 hypothetical protein CUT44_15480 [Streptomyces carminius]
MRRIPSATRTSPCVPARTGARTAVRAGVGALLLAALGGCMTIGSPDEEDGGGRRPAGHQVSRDAADPRPEGVAVPRAGDGHGGGRRGPARKDGGDGAGDGRDRSGGKAGKAGKAGKNGADGGADRDAGDARGRDATRRPSGRSSRPADPSRPGRTPTAGGDRPSPPPSVPSSPSLTTPPAVPSSAPPSSPTSGDGPGEGPDGSLAGAGMNDGAPRVHSVYAYESADSDRLGHHLDHRSALRPTHRPEEPRTDSGEQL